mgnify:FL=1
MQFEEFLNKKITVSQIKSGAKFNKRQQGTLIGLGLRGIGSSSTFQASNEIIGMIKKVAHVIKVSLV